MKASSGIIFRPRLAHGDEERSDRVVAGRAWNIRGDYRLPEVHPLRGEGLTEPLVLQVGQMPRNDQQAFGSEKIRQKPAAVFRAQLRMHRAKLHR